MNYEVNELEGYTLEALRVLWQQVFKAPPSTYAYKEFLINNLVYHKQTQQYGGLNSNTKRHLYQLYESFKDNPNYQPPATRSSLKSGTRLVREWQGVVHTVTAVKQAFEYKGNEYKSLSAIARLITGTRWSGPAFFGLTKRGEV